MQKRTKFAVVVPFLLAPLVFTTGQANAQTQSFGPIGAVQLLAQSKAADAKCQHLSSTEHTELGDYVAKAEVSAAATNSATEAQAARRKGSTAGKAMVCGPKTEELVRATMDAARRAMAAALRQRGRKKVASRHRVEQPQKKVRTKRRSNSNDGVVAVISKPSGNASLTRYRRITAAYYLERRCQHLSRGNAMRFWKKVVASHNAVMRKYSTSQVAKAKSGARAAARNWGSCSTRTARIVKAGYKG